MHIPKPFLSRQLALGLHYYVNPAAHKAHLKSASTILRSVPTDSHLTKHLACISHEMRTQWAVFC